MLINSSRYVSHFDLDNSHQFVQKLASCEGTQINTEIWEQDRRVGEREWGRQKAVNKLRIIDLTLYVSSTKYLACDNDSYRLSSIQDFSATQQFFLFYTEGRWEVTIAPRNVRGFDETLNSRHCLKERIFSWAFYGFFLYFLEFSFYLRFCCIYGHFSAPLFIFFIIF